MENLKAELATILSGLGWACCSDINSIFVWRRGGYEIQFIFNYNVASPFSSLYLREGSKAIMDIRVYGRPDIVKQLARDWCKH